jgi:peptide/nickel transport system substrate-binding protein
MKRTLACLMAGLLSLSCLVGCGGSASTDSTATTTAETTTETTTETTETAAATPTVLNIALNGEPSNLDIAMNTDDLASEVTYGSVFEQLVALNGENEVVCELAESYTISDDATVYTYTLRQGVKFHNGEEMTAEDVVASMNRWIDNTENANNLVGGAHFYVVDDYTVEITMETGTLYLNEMIGGLGQHAAIMPASVINAVGEGELVGEYIGTGPYKLDEWKADQYIHLVKNDDYAPYGTEGDYSGWAGYKTAYYEDVYFYFPGDTATIVNGLQTGEFDITAGLSGDDYATFDGNDDFTIFTDESEMPMLIFNKSEGVASNPLVRQAIQALINCDDVLYASMGNADFYNEYSSYMFESSANWYTEAGSEYYNQNDPDRALELFEEAGWTEDDTFRILVRSDSTDFYIQAQVIQEELRSIGINCELVTLDASTYSDTRNNHPEEWDAFITSFGPKVLPNMNLFLSASWAGWCTDERIQSDLAAIAAETDLATAQQIWSDLQQYMYEEAVPVVKFGTTQLWGVSTSNITGACAKERLVWVNAHPAD